MVKQSGLEPYLNRITDFIDQCLNNSRELLNRFLSLDFDLKFVSIVITTVGAVLLLICLSIVLFRVLGLKKTKTSAYPLKNSSEDNLTKEEADFYLNERFQSYQERSEQERQREEKLKIYEEEKREILANKQKEKKQDKEAEKKDKVLDLDWEKNKKLSLRPEEISQLSLKYQQSQKQLADLIGLIMDMLGRNVDSLKIAQTVMYRNMSKSSEDEVLQTIDAVKNFIALCINGKFDKIANTINTPSIEDALFHLANGDTSYALSLLEKLMDENIDNAVDLPNGELRNELFNTTSNYAVTFGSLAAVSDVHLATGAFELAVELSPQNVNAWNRLGDMYTYGEAESKAVWAYTNVLSMANEELNEQQLANANKMLSQYYYQQGDSLQAAKMYNSSRGYYDSIGINRNLDRQEIEIIELIESRQKELLQDTIVAVLNNKKLAHYTF